MSVIEILTRVEAICQKYDRYDVEKQKDLNVSGDDAFARLYASVDADIEALRQVPLSLSLSLSQFSLHAIPVWSLRKLGKIQEANS